MKPTKDLKDNKEEVIDPKEETDPTEVIDPKEETDQVAEVVKEVDSEEVTEEDSEEETENKEEVIENKEEEKEEVTELADPPELVDKPKNLQFRPKPTEPDTYIIKKPINQSIINL